MDRRIKDMTGQRVGRLTIIRYAYAKNKCAYWLCRCDCGNEKIVRSNSLRSKHNPTNSCGCLHHEWRIEQNTTHGMSDSPEWGIWKSMKQRCQNSNHSNYPLYGGRGIKVCPEWENSFEQFYEDVGPRPSPNHSLDRIDGNGNYEPSNVRWATPTQQSRNSRKVRPITFNGKTQCVRAWAKEIGINPITLYSRLNHYGWSAKRALTEPVHNVGQRAAKAKKKSHTHAA